MFSHKFNAKIVNEDFKFKRGEIDREHVTIGKRCLIVQAFLGDIDAFFME